MRFRLFVDVVQVLMLVDAAVSIAATVGLVARAGCVVELDLAIVVDFEQIDGRLFRGTRLFNLILIKFFFHK